MIRFFRKIRQKLLSENKFSKYLIYAIGEILLVTIGILIALQINNWNESKKFQRNEQIILKNLRADFKVNEEKISSVLKHQNDQKDILEHYIGFIKPGSTAHPDSLVSKLWLTTGYHPFLLADGTLNSLLHSDRIDLIKNENLKEKLTSYPSVYLAYKEHEEEYEMRVNLLRQFAGNHFSFSRYVQTLKNQTESFPPDTENWTDNLRHQNDVAGLYIQMTWYVIPRLEKLQEKTSVILELINENID